MIESEMDTILEQIEVFKRHAITIGAALEITHKQIVLNLNVMTENVEALDDSNRKLKKVLKSWSRPNCCLDVILILLLLALGYLIWRQFS